MRFQHYLLIVLALVLGIFIGRNTVPAAPSSDVRLAHTGSVARPRPDGSAPLEEGSTSARQARPRYREEKKPPQEGRKIALPLELIAKDLKERQLSHMNFTYIGENIDGPLKLLGATDSECKQVKAVFTKTREEIYAAEKLHLKVLRSDSRGVELDTSGMKTVIPGIMAKAQEGIRESMPRELSETLNASVNWEGLYDLTEKYEPAKLAIVRGPEGNLIAQASFGGGGMGSYLNKEDIPTDGSLIQADRFFEGRWTPFLKGVMLEPIDP